MPYQKKNKRTGRKHLQRITKDAVVPHQRNHYRPHLIRGHGLAIVIALIVGVQLIYNFSQTGLVLGQKTDVTAEQLLVDTNAQRSAIGEQPLRLNVQLSYAAAMKADDMLAEQYWAHASPRGTTPWHWLGEARYEYAEAGENLAKGFHTTGGVVTAWMNSPDHRQNILDTGYRDVGFAVKTGYLDGKETTLVVAFYAKPVDSGSQLASSNQPAAGVGTGSSLTPIDRIGVGLQSMTPALLSSIILILLVMVVALGAHRYRNHLPFALRKTWLRHHGLYKALGMGSLVIILLALYGGGQI